MQALMPLGRRHFTASPRSPAKPPPRQRIEADLHQRQQLDCFVVYLAGHNRPMHEVLFPNLKPLQAIFENEFEGMTAEPVDVIALEGVRGHMLHDLPRALLPRQRDFLLSMARAEPDWSLLPYPHLQRLPALQWKLLNLAKLRRSGKRFAMQHDELAVRLDALE